MPKISAQPSHHHFRRWLTFISAAPGCDWVAILAHLIYSSPSRWGFWFLFHISTPLPPDYQYAHVYRHLSNRQWRLIWRCVDKPLMLCRFQVEIFSISLIRFSSLASNAFLLYQVVSHNLLSRAWRDARDEDAIMCVSILHDAKLPFSGLAAIIMLIWWYLSRWDVRLTSISRHYFTISRLYFVHGASFQYAGPHIDVVRIASRYGHFDAPR